MADGINSIADIKIVVDSETETFAKGIEHARGLIAGLGTDSQALGLVDAALGKMGATAAIVQGQVGYLSGAMQSGMGALSPWIAALAMLAEKIGVSEDVERLTGTFGDLGAAVTEAATFSLQALVARLADVKQGAEATQSASDGMSQSLQFVASDVLSKFSEAARDAAANLRAITRSVETLGVEDLTRQVRATEQGIAELTKRFHEMSAAARIAELQGMPKWLRRGGDREADPVEYQRDLEKLTATLTALRAELERKLQESWVTDLSWADIDKYVERLRASTDELMLNNEALGMSKARAAEYLAIRRGEIEAEKQSLAGLPISAEAREALIEEAARKRVAVQAAEDHAEALRREADAKRQAEAVERATARFDEGIERDISALERRRRETMLGRDAIVEQTYAERLLMEVRRAGIDLTPELLAKIHDTASAYAELEQQVRALEDGKRRMQETSSVVSQSISSEFASWTRGAEFDVRKMVSNMLASMAQLTLQRGVLDTLFGGRGGGGGSASGGGLFGDLLGGLFGGAREAGGPVEAGRAYLVGERGPELMLAGQSGQVVPARETAALLGGSGRGSTFAPSVSVSIDARGATVDAVAELQRLKSELPGLIVSTMADARERGID